MCGRTCIIDTQWILESNYQDNYHNGDISSFLFSTTLILKHSDFSLNSSLCAIDNVWLIRITAVFVLAKHTFLGSVIRVDHEYVLVFLF
jgi:hypothetical protein